jgi:hypothetical protein
MRRRALFILASRMLGVLLLGGVALAKEIAGTSGSEDLEGTNRAAVNENAQREVNPGERRRRML